MKSIKEFIPLWKLIKEEKVKLIIASSLILLAGISEIATGYLNGAAVESITNLALKNAVIYLLIYLGIEFVDMINSNLRNNVYLICGFYAITLFYELIIYLSIRNAMKETSKLLNEKK